MNSIKREKDDKKILLVDDDVISLKILKVIVKELGFNFDCAETGKNALDMIENNSNDYCSVILDLGLPDIDGIKLIKIIRERYPDSKIFQIIIVSSYSNEIENEVIEAGANVYISKPAKIMQLKSVLGKCTNVPKA